MTGWMDRVAPRTRAGFWAKAAGFLALINLLNGALVALRGGGYDLVGDLLNTTLVALPFVVFILAILARQRRLQVELATLAATDLLTGLPNRRAFLARGHSLAEGGRDGALILLDADHFKRINDRHGHAVGDACLEAIAERLRAAVGPGDAVGRLGGEEFALFLRGVTREGAAKAGERLCRAIPVETEGLEAGLAVTLSGGAALSDGRTPIERLLARADEALYAAKAQGRARLVLWPPDEAGRRPPDAARPEAAHPDAA